MVKKSLSRLTIRKEIVRLEKLDAAPVSGGERAVINGAILALKWAAGELGMSLAGWLEACREKGPAIKRAAVCNE